MKDRYVVDTNVLIAASAADPTNPKAIDATPDDPKQRMIVWKWLTEFSNGPSRLIWDQGIDSEYRRNLGHADYGMQVVQQKWDTQSVDPVNIEYDEYGFGVLPSPLNEVIHDNEDKKMVAAALVSHEHFGEGCVAFAGDTDWHDWEETLKDNNVILEPIIEEWSRAKHAEKKGD